MSENETGSDHNSDGIARLAAARAEFEAAGGPEVLRLLDAASDAVRRHRRRRRTRNRRSSSR